MKLIFKKKQSPEGTKFLDLLENQIFPYDESVSPRQGRYPVKIGSDVWFVPFSSILCNSADQNKESIEAGTEVYVSIETTDGKFYMDGIITKILFLEESEEDGMGNYMKENYMMYYPNEKFDKAKEDIVNEYLYNLSGFKVEFSRTDSETKPFLIPKSVIYTPYSQK